MIFTFSKEDAALSFLSVLFEGVPFLLLGSLISGLVDVFVSSERLAKILPQNRTGSILACGALGLTFPMCECGSVIVIRRFIRKGLPVSCAITYMLGAPIVSPVVALSTYAAFSGAKIAGAISPGLMTSLRLLLGYGIAVALGLLIERLNPAKLLQPALLGPTGSSRGGLRVASAPSEGAADFAALAEGVSFPRKLLLSIQSATADFLDVAFFFIIGCGISSVFNTALNQAVIQPFATTPLPAITVMMVLAALLALCSTTDAFVAASYISFPWYAKLAFLVFGPVFDLKLFWLYGLIFQRRVVVLLSLGLFAVIAFICWQLSGLKI